MEKNKCVLWMTLEVDEDGNQFYQIICYDNNIADDLNVHYLYDEKIFVHSLKLRFFHFESPNIKESVKRLERISDCINIDFGCGYAFVKKQ